MWQKTGLLQLFLLFWALSNKFFSHLPFASSSHPTSSETMLLFKDSHALFFLSTASKPAQNFSTRLFQSLSHHKQLHSTVFFFLKKIMKNKCEEKFTHLFYLYESWCGSSGGQTGRTFADKFYTGMVSHLNGQRRSSRSPNNVGA